MRLGRGEKRVLRAMAGGSRLQSHRYLDGTKIYALHSLDDAAPATPVPAAVVEHLRSQGLLESNMKFPAATYLLTVQGLEAAAALSSSPLRPLISRLTIGR